MLAQSHARKPAPPLAARGMWLRLHGGADAFGSALGDAVVGSIVQAERERRLPDEVKQMSPDQKARVLDLASRGNGKIDLNNPEHLATIKRASETQTEAGQDFSRAELQSRTGDYLKIAGASDDEIAQVQDFYKKSRAYLPEGRFYIGDPLLADSQGLGTPPTGPQPNDLKPVLGDVADASAIRLGGVVRQIGEEINSRPAIGWALTALDVAAGPAVYAVRKGFEASPLGEIANKATQWLFDKTASLFSGGGYTPAQSSDGATGVFTVANVAMAGFAGAVKLGYTAARPSSLQRTQLQNLRGGGEVHVGTAEEARALLNHMQELRPATQERLLPNPTGGLANGFKDPRGTYRGDLINKSDPTAPIHPGVQNLDHANYPHYNITLPDGNKAAIIIKGN